MRDYLREQVPLTAAECEVCFSGEPPPICGERYVAVHPGRWTGGRIEGLEEEFGVQITCTLRAAKDFGLRAIGIEIEERYCRFGANRMAQEILFPLPRSVSQRSVTVSGPMAGSFFFEEVEQ